MRVSSIFLIALSGAFAIPTGAGRVAFKTTARVRLTVHIAHLFDGRPLRMEDVSLRNGAGNTLSVTRLAYLISDVTLRRADGASVTLAGQTAYVNPAEGRDAFTLTDVPAGHYVGLAFRVGLLPKINHSDPSRYAADSPLHPLVNRLHWGWQGGYVFLALEGRYEQPGGRLGGYSYHLATDRNLMRVRLARNFRVEQDSALHLAFDVAKVLAGASLIVIEAKNGGDTTHSAPGDKLAAHLTANVEQAFRFQGIFSTRPITSGTSSSALSLSLTPATNSANFSSISSAKPSNDKAGGRRTAGTGRVTPLASRATPYAFPTPAHFPQPLLPADNPLTLQGIALGKTLFFEPKLSGNNSQSCASCHQPEHAFAHAGKSVSAGIDGKPGTRRSMPLFNLAWQSAFTWDGRRTRLRDQVLAPVQDAREMRQSLPQAVAKLRNDPKYPELFAQAFGSPDISAERIGLAVEQYLLTLVSANAKFDRALRGEAQFTDEEKRGLLLFVTEYDPARGKTGADCFHCHGGNLFTDYQFRNNGLDAQFKDGGRFLVTGRSADRGKFKTPSLRNAALTAPYMHDGRFRSLEDVVRHYSAGVRRSDTLDPNIAKHPDEGMALSDEDVRSLVAFLKTLTDAPWRSPPPEK